MFALPSDISARAYTFIVGVKNNFQKCGRVVTGEDPTILFVVPVGAGESYYEEWDLLSNKVILEAACTMLTRMIASGFLVMPTTLEDSNELRCAWRVLPWSQYNRYLSYLGRRGGISTF